METVTRRTRPGTSLWSADRLRRDGWQVAKYVVLIAFLIFFLFPIIWVWLAALKSTQEINQDPFMLPATLHWENLIQAWTVGHFSRYVWNTVIYCAFIVSGDLLFSGMAGYSLAKLTFPGRDLIFNGFLLGLMVPFQSIMIPLYYLLRDLHILGTYAAF